MSATYSLEPGEIYRLPSEEGSHDKNVDRPHVVVSPADQNEVLATFVYGTTSEVQARVYFASHVAVPSTSSLFKVTGLRETTYFYPSRLVVCHAEDAGPVSGKLIDEFPELRDRELPRAVGLGTGTCDGEGRARGSKRGRIVKFKPVFSKLIETGYGLVITEPLYSNRSQIQNFIPIFDAREFETVPPSIAVFDLDWVDQMPGLKGALLMLPLVQSAYESDDIDSYLPNPVDMDTMNAVDEGLASRLFGARLADVIGSSGDGDGGMLGSA